jgi:hypothetical protein
MTESGMRTFLILRAAVLALGFTVVLELATFLPLANFAKYQIAFSIALLVCWIADFGIVTAMNRIVRSPDEILLKSFSTIRQILALFAIITTLAISTIFGIDFQYSLLLSALIIDNYVDNSFAIRQISLSGRQNIYYSVSKKALQVILIAFLEVVNQLSFINLGIAFAVSNVAILWIEYTKFGFSLSNLSTRRFHDSWKFWFQSGGTVIANLDVLIISNFGGANFLSPIALSRKFSQSIGVLGSTLVPQTVSDFSKNRNSPTFRIPHLYRYAFFSFIGSISVAVIFPRISNSLFSISFSKSELFVFLVIVCLTPIGVLTTNFNAAFLGLNRPGLAALTTYLSTFIYFVTLAFFGFKGILWIGILLGVILNQFSELVLLRLLFSRARMQL